MSYFIKKEKVVFLNDLEIKVGRSEGLAPLTDEQIEKHLTGLYKLINGKQELKTVNYLEEAKTTRDSAISSDLESGGFLWQVRDTVDLQNIQDGIDEALYNPSKADEVISFRMADNTWQEITISDLEKAKSDYRNRKLAIYSKFKAWTETDMLAPFEI